MKCNVMAIKLDKRTNNAIKVQEILTKHGCIIQNRIGFHEANENVCSDCGVIILTLVDKAPEIELLKADLNSIQGLHSALISL